MHIARKTLLEFARLLDQSDLKFNFDNSQLRGAKVGELSIFTTYIIFVGGFFIDLPETRQNVMIFSVFLTSTA